MQTNTISDKAFVLSRIDYGETDRILSVLCSDNGKLNVIAKGVRKGKSKLAGGIELFAENELVLLKSRGDLYIVTSSRMNNYFGNITKDIDASSYAYECLKMLNKLTPDGAGGEYYQPLLNLMKALDKNKIPLTQIKIWFGLKILKNLGSLPNFETDSKGGALPKDSKFKYDFDRHCFIADPGSSYDSNHVKLLRFLSKTSVPVEIKEVKTKTIEDTERLVSLILRTHLN